jgi:PAS domain S-box-containing protein
VAVGISPRGSIVHCAALGLHRSSQACRGLFTRGAGTASVGPAGINTGLWDWNLKANEVYFSPEWKHQLGYENHEIPNRYEEWEARLHPEDRTRTLNAVRASIKDPASAYEVEFRLRHKDGSYRWILARASLLQDPEGHAYRMLGSHTDITERKEAENQLANSRFTTGSLGLRIAIGLRKNSNARSSPRGAMSRRSR